jgi:hypothetical protein
MAELQKITIGFHGQSLPVRASRDQVADLIGVLGNGTTGWYDMQTDDGALFLDLGKIEFVRTDAHEQRVGFGLA